MVEVASKLDAAKVKAMRAKLSKMSPEEMKAKMEKMKQMMSAMSPEQLERMKKLAKAKLGSQSDQSNKLSVKAREVTVGLEDIDDSQVTDINLANDYTSLVPHGVRAEEKNSKDIDLKDLYEKLITMKFGPAREQLLNSIPPDKKEEFISIAKFNTFG